MAKKQSDLEQLIKVKIYLEQIRYACQRLDKNFSFNIKDINQAIESLNDSSQSKPIKSDLIKNAYSNLKATLANDLVDNIAEIKSLEKLLKRVIK